MRLDETDALHGIAATWQGERILVEHSVVERFSAAVSDLLRELGEDQSDEFWADITRPLKLLRWRLATVPVPVTDPCIDVVGVAERLDLQLRSCAQFRPSAAECARVLSELLLELASCDDDPLGDSVRALGADQAGYALLLRDGSMLDPVARALGPDCTLVTAPQLMRTRFEHVIAVGPSAWFPPELLRAPRAPTISFTYFGWLRDWDPQADLLVGTLGHVRLALSAPPPRDRTRPPLMPADDIRTWEPQIEWRAVHGAAERATGEGGGDPIGAQLVVLASGDGVYLEDHEDARVYVAELDDEIHVRQIPVAHLKDGMFLVLRTEGDGDYVREVADDLMGSNAMSLRGYQRKWKAGLRREVDTHGTRRTIELLRQHGAARANEINVRNWLSDGFIRPQNEADLRAICALIEEPFEAYLQAMTEIRQAHLTAGQKVRRLLVEEIRGGNSDELLRKGWVDYDVEAIEGEGSLRVARVVGRAPELVEVRKSKLRRPFALPENQWLG